MGEMVPIVFKILNKENKSISNGNIYVECETDNSENVSGLTYKHWE